MPEATSRDFDKPRIKTSLLPPDNAFLSVIKTSVIKTKEKKSDFANLRATAKTEDSRVERRPEGAAAFAVGLSRPREKSL